MPLIVALASGAKVGVQVSESASTVLFTFNKVFLLIPLKGIRLLVLNGP